MKLQADKLDSSTAAYNEWVTLKHTSEHEGTYIKEELSVSHPCTNAVRSIPGGDLRHWIVLPTQRV